MNNASRTLGGQDGITTVWLEKLVDTQAGRSPGGAASPVAEQEGAREGEDEDDDGEHQLELLVLVLVGEPVGTAIVIINQIYVEYEFSSL